MTNTLSLHQINAPLLMILHVVLTLQNSFVSVASFSVVPNVYYSHNHEKVSSSLLMPKSVVVPTFTKTRSAQRTFLAYWSNDNSNGNNGGNQNSNGFNNNNDWEQQQRAMQREIEDLENARLSFEALLQERTTDGIQDDGIVLTSSNEDQYNDHLNFDSIYHSSFSSSFSSSFFPSSTPRGDTYWKDTSFINIPPATSAFGTHDNGTPSHPRDSDDTTRSSTDMLLTSSGRLLRELEIKLLSSLLDTRHECSNEIPIEHEANNQNEVQNTSNENFEYGESGGCGFDENEALEQNVPSGSPLGAAAEALIHFWVTERDSHAANDLLTMSNQQCSDGLVSEEIKLKAMTEAYPVWAEPYSRLATLKFYKGEYDQAEYYAEYALSLKPWHFEAIQMLVLVLLKLNKKGKAMDVQNMTLPPISEPQRRAVWVQNALRQANEQLENADIYTKQYYYHQKEQRTNMYEATSSGQTGFQADDIWQ